MASPPEPRSPRDTTSCVRPINTTPDVASPRLSTDGPEAPLPPLSRLGIVVTLALSAWGFGMVAVAILKSL